MNNNVSVLPVRHNPSNVVPFDAAKKSQEKEIRRNKDGSICRIEPHKTAGQSSEVYAFRTQEEIAAMMGVFDQRIESAANANQRQIAWRNKLLFIVGINTGVRASDLQSLRFGFFLKSAGSFEFCPYYVLQPMKQRKTHKFLKLYFNRAVRTAIRNYLKEYPIQSLDEYLFPSRKGDGHIEAKSICKIIKEAAAEAGIAQNVGSHSLRKTWGRWIFHEAGDKNKALVMLQQAFGHSSTTVTARYIGITDDEIKEMFNSIDLGLDMI